MSNTLFTRFKSPTEHLALPKKFTFPFYYEPHPLTVIAAQELQQHIINQKDWVHNFGNDPKMEGLEIGKMFGVLVVLNKQGHLGYLCAFSGKLAEQNNHPQFVPPIFDMLTEGGFFRAEEKVLNALNTKIEELEQKPAFLELSNLLDADINLSKRMLKDEKEQMKLDKKKRKLQRGEAKEILNKKQYEVLNNNLADQSVRSNYYLKDLTRCWQIRIADLERKRNVFLDQINAMKNERKTKSAALQQKLFDQYQFLNITGTPKSVIDIFKNTSSKTPPAGAGECAAPKLLQYAFKHKLKPLALAEFWWGKTSAHEIRKQGNFYPACRGKCEPILNHMLIGLDTDPNPMLINPAIGKTLEYVYEDGHLIVINKPTEFLSVPGKTIKDSVYERIRQKYPLATGPLIVHRLDMSTSGLMLIAKTKEVHKSLQNQFIRRKVTKRYIAVLDGIVSENEGYIELPLRVDLQNRPHQMVCNEHGKSAKTSWKVISKTNEATRIHFYPLTGRTHQLRVHAAHPLGLDCPIIGDDLYGDKANRLHLHAEYIKFWHPVKKETVWFQVDPDF